jgi:hypothetical protein
MPLDDAYVHLRQNLVGVDSKPFLDVDLEPQDDDHPGNLIDFCRLILSLILFIK